MTIFWIKIFDMNEKLIETIFVTTENIESAIDEALIISKTSGTRMLKPNILVSDPNQKKGLMRGPEKRIVVPTGKTFYTK